MGRVVGWNHEDVIDKEGAGELAHVVQLPSAGVTCHREWKLMHSKSGKMKRIASWVAMSVLLMVAVILVSVRTLDPGQARQTVQLPERIFTETAKRESEPVTELTSAEPTKRESDAAQERRSEQVTERDSAQLSKQAPAQATQREKGIVEEDIGARWQQIAGSTSIADNRLVAARSRDGSMAMGIPLPNSVNTGPRELQFRTLSGRPCDFEGIRITQCGARIHATPYDVSSICHEGSLRHAIRYSSAAVALSEDMIQGHDAVVTFMEDGVAKEYVWSSEGFSDVGGLTLAMYLNRQALVGTVGALSTRPAKDVACPEG